MSPGARAASGTGGGREPAGKVVVVTGASAGIGAALTRLLAARGDSVAAVARRDERLRALADAAADGPGRVLPVVADVTMREQVRRAVREALEALGRIDVWINNVGQGITLAPSELTDEDVDAMIRTNVLSAVYGTQEILPHFRERGSGHLINVSSLLGRVPFVAYRSAYTGAKHFLNGWTASLRDELVESDPGIAVSLVSPGVVRTEFGASALHGGPDSRQLPYSQSPEEVAEVIAGVVDVPRPDVYTLPGAKERVAAYYAALGEDAPPSGGPEEELEEENDTTGAGR